jgi:hypothetical protein
MKRILFVGLIALLVMLVAPAMAETSAPVAVDGTLLQSLSIACNVGTGTFGTLVNGDNYAMAQGTLTVSALRTPWKVTTTTSTNPNGFMLLGGTGVNLANPMKQQELGSWVIVKDWTVSSPQSGTLTAYPYVLDYYQSVVDADLAGAYWTTATYTVAAT